jgi:hypothetical protein
MILPAPVGERPSERAECGIYNEWPASVSSI